MEIRELILVTPTQYQEIRRSRVRLDERLARRYQLPEELIKQIRAGCSLREAVSLCVRPGLRVRLDTSMGAGGREPAVGEWGTVTEFAADDGGKLFVAWDGGSTLAVIPEQDRISYLAGHSFPA